MRRLPASPTVSRSASGRRRGVGLCHQLPQPTFRLDLRQPVPAPRLANWPKRPLDQTSTDVPLAVPATALLEHAAGPARPALMRSAPTALAARFLVHDATDGIGSRGLRLV
jgi:hypothetical protein